MKDSNFHLLTDPESTTRLAEWLTDEMKTEIVRCPIHDDDHRRGGKRLTDLSVALPGSSVDDFVWTWQSECLIQDHVLRVLENKRFTGFEVRPISARFKRKNAGQPPRLWELVVTGWDGLAPEASGIHLTEQCQACQYLHYSPLTHPEYLIDEARWDGSDFFIVWPLPKFRFITDRVAQTIREEKWKGVRIQGLTELPCDDMGFSPGRLSYWMPEPRARELGEPLGIY